ncbi:hypothetical protein XBO1_2180001 [Xenorhabdus bovienii str. oregonense]|uniref:Phage minor tail protein n=1 Tax=Xenorhabdus bovienii str. oregonense TaxID=1398202 RepID=A0A077P6P4_XENBV|nr:hypothetical protein XBO1_2180001 [Xenorhabdus bovienii str. oregonense]
MFSLTKTLIVPQALSSLLKQTSGYLGTKEEVTPIFQFIRNHTVKSFIWRPPFGEKGLYRVKSDSITMTPMAGGIMKISATFEQAFSA